MTGVKKKREWASSFRKKLDPKGALQGLQPDSFFSQPSAGPRTDPTDLFQRRGKVASRPGEAGALPAGTSSQPSDGAAAAQGPKGTAGWRRGREATHTRPPSPRARRAQTGAERPPPTCPLLAPVSTWSEGRPAPEAPLPRSQCVREAGSALQARAAKQNWSPCLCVQVTETDRAGRTEQGPSLTPGESLKAAKRRPSAPVPTAPASRKEEGTARAQAEAGSTESFFLHLLPPQGPRAG